MGGKRECTNHMISVSLVTAHAFESKSTLHQPKTWPWTTCCLRSLGPQDYRPLWSDCGVEEEGSPLSILTYVFHFRALFVISSGIGVSVLVLALALYSSLCEPSPTVCLLTATGVSTCYSHFLCTRSVARLSPLCLSPPLSTANVANRKLFLLHLLMYGSVPP